VSPELPYAESRQSSTQSGVDFDNNCAQSQTHQSFDAFLSYWLEADSNYDEENQPLYTPLDSFSEGLDPNFVARHTQDKGFYEIAISEISQQNEIPSQHTPPSYLDPVPGIVFGSQRANSFYGDVCQNASDAHLGRELPSYESSSVSDTCINSCLQASSVYFLTFTSLHSEPQQDWDYLGARPRQSSISPNSQSQHYWNRLGARPREHQYSTSATLPSHPQQDDDWASPVTRPQQVLRGLAYDVSIEDESLQVDEGREGTGENLEAGINSAFLLKHSTDQALLAWALREHLLMEEERVQLGTRIKRKEKLIREERACKEEKEFQEINSCNLQVHVSDYM